MHLAAPEHASPPSEALIEAPTLIISALPETFHIFFEEVAPTTVQERAAPTAAQFRFLFVLLRRHGRQ